jgi:hypothetical protein
MNDKKIKSIDIVFENCEEFNIPASCVEFLYATINKKTIRVQNYSNHEECEQSESLTAKYFKICISNIDEIPDSTMMGTTIGEKFITRIQGNDITQIHIQYNDNSTFWFHVLWNYDNEYCNTYQYNCIKDNNLWIIISKDKLEAEEVE